MKLLLILLTLFSFSGAIEPFTYYWSINLNGDTATVSKWKNNNDSVLVWADKVCDTINILPRWNWFSNHDSTFLWMNIDTISGKTYMDTIDLYRIYCDSMYCDRIGAYRFTTDTLNADTINTNFIVVDTVVSDTINSRFIFTDSIQTTKSINTLTFSDSMYSANGINITTNVTCDSLNVRVMSSDSITTNNEDYFTYIDTTFYDSLFEDNSYKSSRRLCRIIQNGKTVTMYQDSMTATLTGGLVVDVRGIPSKFFPTSYTTYRVKLFNGAVASDGAVWFNFWGSNRFVLVNESGAFSSGRGGTQRFYLNWIIE